MAPEQIQACIEACNLCADMGDAYVRTLTDRSDEAQAENSAEALRDAAAMCRITASSLSRVSEASRICCEACAQLCELAARDCALDDQDEVAQCERALLHCADECRRLADGLPEARYHA